MRGVHRDVGFQTTIRTLAFFGWSQPWIPQYLMDVVKPEPTQSHHIPGLATATVLPARVHATMHVALDVTLSRILSEMTGVHHALL